MRKKAGVMKMYMLTKFILISLLFSLASCSDNADDLRINDDINQVAMQLDDLTASLNRGVLNNAAILKIYAAKLKVQKPAYGALMDQFAQRATGDNPTISDFEKRFQQAIVAPRDTQSEKKALLISFKTLKAGTDKQMYDDSLLDLINTIADLSDGQLSRVETPRRAAGELPASQLVGNPQYGHWQQESGGQSFWAWYGQYALLSSLLGGNRYSYGNWSNHRGWSHYNDYGRSRYSSPTQRRQHDTTMQKNERNLKQYGRNSGRTRSSYGSTRSNPAYASTLSSRSIKAAKAARYKSSYGSSSRGSGSASRSSTSKNRHSSSYGSSSRSSSYSSRSRFGGK
ncbi:MAG: hypothetical protein Q9M31_06270 [Mariprofundus sp.]|nr:hypothetical protein [Mariprofundus sp.]